MVVRASNIIPQSKSIPHADPRVQQELQWPHQMKMEPITTSMMTKIHIHAIIERLNRNTMSIKQMKIIMNIPAKSWKQN